MVAKTALRIVVGLGLALMSVSPACGASFTLSDAALMSLDWNLQNAYFDPINARILERRDIAGPGVEFDIFFPGNVGNDGLFYAVSSSRGGSGALLGQDISGYNSFDLAFTLVSVNGQPTTIESDYLAVGSLISKLNSTWGYKPYGLDLRNGTQWPSHVLAATSSNDTETRVVGFIAYLLPFDYNYWSPQGTTLTLLVGPAPGAFQLWPRSRRVTPESFVLFAAAWMETGCIWPKWCGGGDLNTDGVVNLSDFAILSKRWMMDPLLLGHWRLDGDYADSANDYLGTVQGDPMFVGAEQAKVGSGAVDLDGNDAVVVSGFTGITGTAARSCMAWIKTTGTAAPIVYWGDKNAAGGTWDVRVNAAGQLRVQSVGGGGANSVSTVNTGQWVHVAAVLPEGGNNIDDAQLYVNGVLETGGALAAGPINTKALASMRIGTDEAGKYFTGLIDDVRVYDRALTAEEIAAVMGQ